MSWTRTTGTVSKADAVSVLLAARAPQADEDTSAIQLDQLAAVAEALPGLLLAVGRKDDQVQVEVAGNANTDHAPVEDVGDEVLHVTVRCIPAEGSTAD